VIIEDIIKCLELVDQEIEFPVCHSANSVIVVLEQPLDFVHHVKRKILVETSKISGLLIVRSYSWLGRKSRR